MSLSLRALHKKVEPKKHSKPKDQRHPNNLKIYTSL
jgi:hypothetical protein